MRKKILSRDDILHLAKLAKLSLTEKEVEKYQKQLEETVKYVSNLNELSTENVKPTPQATNLTNVFFEDGEKNFRQLSENETLANAKNKKDNYFVVKRIM